MPFDKNLTNIFDTIIKDTIESKGLRCERADDFMTNNAILSDIIDGICKARFLIADITGYNRNVMYELEIAHALQKEVIMVYQNQLKNLQSSLLMYLTYGLFNMKMMLLVVKK